MFLPKLYNETRHLFQNAQVTESHVDYIQVPSCTLPFYTHLFQGESICNMTNVQHYNIYYLLLGVDIVHELASDSASIKH